jgi:hypothetical protein
MHYFAKLKLQNIAEKESENYQNSTSFIEIKDEKS